MDSPIKTTGILFAYTKVAPHEGEGYALHNLRNGTFVFVPKNKVESDEDIASEAAFMIDSLEFSPLEFLAAQIDELNSIDTTSNISKFNSYIQIYDGVETFHIITPTGEYARLYSPNTAGEPSYDLGRRLADAYTSVKSKLQNNP